jgi:signal transduction histidine kinase
VTSGTVPELASLLAVDELTELCARITRPLGAALTIEDARGQRLVGAPIGVTSVTRDLRCGGVVIGRVMASGPTAESAASIAVAAIELAARHAWTGQRASTASAALAGVAAARTTTAEGNERADRARASFLAMMSHELRTPLTSVMGYAELLLEGLAGPINAEQTEHLRTILGKSEQLLAVIGALLDVARASSGAPSDLAAVPLAPLVHDIVGRHVELAGRRNLRVQIDAAPLVAYGDRRQLRQLITNLLDNAIKFSRDGGVIDVRVAPGPLRADGGPNAAHIVVRDRGVGIPPEAMGRIFDPFFQVDSSSTRSHGGAGIGLTVARAFAEAHGGRLWLEPTDGPGATFVVAVPLDHPGEASR